MNWQLKSDPVVFERGVDLNARRFDLVVAPTMVGVLTTWGSARAFRKICVLAAHGPPTRKDLSPVREALRRGPADPIVQMSRSVPVHGVRAAHAAREPARYRGLPARASGQALPVGRKNLIRAVMQPSDTHGVGCEMLFDTDCALNWNSHPTGQDGSLCTALTPIRGASDRDSPAGVSRSGAVLERARPRTKTGFVQGLLQPTTGASGA